MDLLPDKYAFTAPCRYFLSAEVEKVLAKTPPDPDLLRSLLEKTHAEQELLIAKKDLEIKNKELEMTKLAKDKELEMTKLAKDKELEMTKLAKDKELEMTRLAMDKQLLATNTSFEIYKLR